VIELSRRQLDFGDGLIAEEVGELWEDWMRHVDAVLDDPQLLDAAYQALARRWTHSRTCGRRGTPVDVVVRLLILKHIRNWSYAALEREVRSNLVYRQFTRIGAAKVPDAKTLGKLGIALGPAVIEQIHQRIVAIAQEQKVIRGRRMRVDTTVVEADIHYATDASLLGDGVRVLTRAMKRIAKLTGDAGAKLRDRTRSTSRCLNHIGRAARGRGQQSKQRMIQCYRRLMTITQRVVGQARRFVREVTVAVKRCKHRRDWVVVLRSRLYLETMIPRVRQVLRQTRQRIDEGNTHAAGKIVSLFEPDTEVIRKGKAGKPTEFGKMVKIQEAENQIVTHYEVYDRARPTPSSWFRRWRCTRNSSVRCLVWWQLTPRGPRPWRQASRSSESQHQECRAQGASAQALVPKGDEVAHRLRGAHQSPEAPPWAGPVPLQGHRRHEAMGRPRRDRRQPHQHRSGARCVPGVLRRKVASPAADPVRPRSRASAPAS
jgi:IS5 family transposase